MKTKIIVLFVIALAIFTIGCGAAAETQRPPAPKPSRTPAPSPSPTPILSESEKSNLKARYANLTAITMATMEKDVLLNGRTIPDMLCDASSNFDEAADLERDVTDPTEKAAESAKVILPETAAKLTRDHLKIYTVWVFKAAKTPNLMVECYRGEGRNGLTSQILHDLVNEYEKRKIDISTSGMTLEAIRALALTRDREYLADVRAALPAKATVPAANAVPIKTKTLSLGEAVEKWEDYSYVGFWNFKPSELGFTQAQIEQLEDKLTAKP